jgi:excisionase family DNA binding protein
MKPIERSLMADSDKIPQLVTIDRLAERLGVTERFIRRLVAEDRIPYHKLGKPIRFAEDEVAEWLETTRRPQGGRGRPA